MRLLRRYRSLRGSLHLLLIVLSGRRPPARAGVFPMFLTDVAGPATRWRGPERQPGARDDQ
ncbi:hypothetical protein VH88_12185 [Brevundimonas sp. KM4]|nr:hypothetical protein VH88_12185 [Brevundimonas sp. KM4]